MYPVDAIAMREGKASLPIAAGEQEMSVSVTIRWAIDNRPVALPDFNNPPRVQPSFPGDA